MGSQYCKKRILTLHVTEAQLTYFRELVQMDGGMHAEEHTNYDLLNDYLEEEYRTIHGPDMRQDPSPGYREE